jgi:hypothetical protein
MVYPIGEFEPQTFSTELKNNLIAQISFAPQKLELTLQTLDAAQLQTPYRQGAWTIQQLAHHIADSHLMAYTRTKLALTQTNPTIVPYNQDAWVTLPDATLPYNLATTILHALHKKWVHIFNSLTNEQYMLTYLHPEYGPQTLWHQLGLYAWHGNHHIAQIAQCKTQHGWH